MKIARSEAISILKQAEEGTEPNFRGFHLLMLEPDEEVQFLEAFPAVRKYVQVVDKYNFKQCWVWVRREQATGVGLPSLPDKPRLSIATRLLRVASGDESTVGFPMCGNLNCLRPSHLATPKFADRYLREHGIETSAIIRARREGRLIAAVNKQYYTEAHERRAFEILRLYFEEGLGHTRLGTMFNMSNGSIKDIIEGRSRKEEYKQYWKERKVREALEVAMRKEANTTTQFSNKGMNKTERRTTKRELPYRVRETGFSKTQPKEVARGNHTIVSTERTETGRRISSVGMPKAADEM